MSTPKRIEARCQHCNTWFRTGIMFPKDYDFDPNAMHGMLKECPKCGNVTSLTKQNMRVRSEHEEG